MGMRAALSFALAGALASAGCSSKGKGGDDAGAPPASASGTPVASAAAVTPASKTDPLSLAACQGSVLARSPAGDALYVADEDHRALRIVKLPFDPAAQARSVTLSGAPAQVLALDDRVLVTLRDPGMLIAFRRDAEAGLVELGRVPLPADAWGLAVTPDRRTVIVSSAWTHQVSAVDLGAMTKRWSVDVAREPRGIAVRADGASAYVTHLVGAALTRLDDLGGAAPAVHRVELPASPLRAPSGRSLGASLGYAAALSDDGSRLFVARHALGAMGKEAWFGAATVDVLLTGADAPLGPKHFGRLPFQRADKATTNDEIKLPGGSLAPFTQPRAVVYRKSTSTVLVVGEGDDLVAELDALTVDPSLAPLRTYPVGTGYDPVLPVAASCAAPAGLALSADESTAWVFCRATYDLAEIRLDPLRDDAPFEAKPPRVARLAEDPEGASAALGRRLFYNATDRITSGGVACSGCHPEGRDDGFTWHEAKFNSAEGTSVNFVGTSENVPEEERVKGFPRRTPMLAGRLGAAGPYGWHAESPTLEDRLTHGVALHRWGALPRHEPGNIAARAAHLVAFLRRGLVTPPREEHPLTPEETRGHEVFVSEAARCSKCHVPTPEYTDRTPYPLMKLPKREDFDDEPAKDFKTPSLLFVSGHAPYFHDGSAASLEELVERNADRMGKTSHLSKEERAALVAFLRTL
jgi:DNA-binding beta-propeller fold protein YncE